MTNYIDFNVHDSPSYKAKIDESLNLLRQPPVSSTPSGGDDGEEYTVDAWASIDTLVDGLTYTFKAHTANTGACSIDHNESPTISIKLIDGSDPAAGQIAAGGVYNLLRDGSSLVLFNPSVSLTSLGALSSVLTADFGVTSDTTLADVTNFDPLTLAANTEYFIECLAVATYDSANNAKIQLTLDPVPQSSKGLMWEKSMTDDGGSLLSNATIINLPQTLNMTSGAGFNHYHLHLLTDADEVSQLKVQFAQNTSGATPSSLKAGSFLRATKV